MKAFKIRNKKTGLFATAGFRGKDTKEGKFYSRINFARSSMKNKLMYSFINVEPDDYEIVEYELVEKCTHPVKKGN